jgi:D-alanine-D-alanine ligase
MTQNVAVLYNDSPSLIKGEARDMLAEQGVVFCAHSVVQALQDAGYRVAPVPIVSSVEEALAPHPPDQWLVFNLGEGLEGRLFEEARIAWALEAMGYRFTGADGDALAWSTHKARTKKRLHAAGIATPRWRVFGHEYDGGSKQDHGNGSLSFPLIVKPLAEDGSLGIGPDAVVRTPEALRQRVAYVLGNYRQMALVEEFVEGREFNVSLWGDPVQLLPLAEVDLSAFARPCQRIVSFAAKWEVESYPYSHTPVTCPADVEPAHGQAIAAVARQTWSSLGCRGYARVDMRVADDGTPYVLEVNCNPDISPEAGFFRAAQAAGYDYPAMVGRILEMARERCNS